MSEPSITSSEILGVSGDLTFEPFVSVKFAAKASGLPYRQILDAINQGKIPLKTLSGKRGKIFMSDLYRAINSQTKGN
jgi:hypothetical protein